MARYKSLVEAMDAKDELAEAEIRYKLLAETFEGSPQLRANLNPALERAKAEIGRLRAMTDATPAAADPKIVPFDKSRFQKKEIG